MALVVLAVISKRRHVEHTNAARKFTILIMGHEAKQTAS